MASNETREALRERLLKAAAYIEAQVEGTADPRSDGLTLGEEIGLFREAADALLSTPPAEPSGWQEAEAMRARLDKLIADPANADVREVLEIRRETVDALLKLRPSPPAAEAALVVEVRQESIDALKSACDRTWSDETPDQVCTIAANGIYWRNWEIEKLKGPASPKTARAEPPADAPPEEK